MQLILPKTPRNITYTTGLVLSLMGLGAFTLPGLMVKRSQPTLTEEFVPFPNHVEVTVLSDGSMEDFSWTLSQVVDWDSTETVYSVDFTAPDFSCFQTIWDSLLVQEQWDTLPQIHFWRKVMSMSKDSAIVNFAHNRQMLDVIPVWRWERMGDSLQAKYKDSLRMAHGLDSLAGIYITAGKNHYYQFEKALPSIGRGIDAFQRRGVDPWYAQAILLIESPGQLHMSPVGAYGSFQLMKGVALEHGLIVTDSLDEREDFEKAAGAAADLIRKRCIPQIRWLLSKREIPFDESDLWFKLLVLHAYHAGSGNVDAVLGAIQPSAGGVELMRKVWTTESGGFKNASQNYSQIALASFLELDRVVASLPDTVCRDTVFLWRKTDLEAPVMNY